MVWIVTPAAIGGLKSAWGTDSINGSWKRWRAFVETLAADADAELPEP